MKKTTLVFLFLILTLATGFAQTPDFTMVGFAAENGGTTGGEGGSVITVSNATELIAAIGTKNTTPRIILVTGNIDNAGTEIPIKECANITLFGAGNNILISKTPIIITNSSNIIIRNLQFTMTGKTGGKDIIEITTTGSEKSQNIWIDHCEFYNETPTVEGSNSKSIKDRYDGLLDIKKNSDYITISWSYFHDHYKAILVGFTTADTYDRKITMHHNRFERINSRIPSYRGGTAHIYNNYFEGWVENNSPQGNCIHTREGCNLLVENNYFTKLNRTVYWDPNDAAEGYAYGTGNYFGDEIRYGFTSKPGATLFVPPYGALHQDDVMNIETLVKQYAGVGILTAYDDYGGTAPTNKLPVVNITSPQLGAHFESPADVTITADAGDMDGSITKVEFYNNNNLIYTANAEPYTFTLNGLMAGKLAVTAKAYDNDGDFATKAVAVTVVPPPVDKGESLFGSTAPLNDYFWFGDNAEAINELYANGTISGTADFKPSKTVEETTRVGAIEILSGGDVIFKLPSCAFFKLYTTRSGSFGGNIYVSLNPANGWGESISGFSGAKGVLELDLTESIKSKSEIYVKIHNTASGGMNIFGADILLAAAGNVSNETIETNKNAVAVKYYDLRGVEVLTPRENAVFIRETIFDDGTKQRIKVLGIRNEK